MHWNESNIIQLVDGYFKYRQHEQQAEVESLDSENPFECASADVYDLRKEVIVHWLFIESSYALFYGTEHADVYSAGVIEDFVVYHGKSHIHKIKELAQRDQRFKELLWGVWRQDTPLPVWKEFERIRSEE